MEVENVVLIDDDNTKEILSNHEDRIIKLETTTKIMEDRFSNVDYQIADIKADTTEMRQDIKELRTTLLQNFNSLTNTMSQVAINTSNNNTKIETAKTNSNKEIILKALGIILIIVLGILVGFGIDVSSFVR